MFKFQFHSLTDKLYGITVNDDDNGSAQQIGAFSAGRMSVWSSPATLPTSTVALTFAPGTAAKLKTGELTESKLHYDTVLASGQALSAVLA